MIMISTVFAQAKKGVIQAFRFSSLLEKVLFATIVVTAVILSNHLWNGDVLFHTDLARDFLVLEDIVATKKPTMIGPRSGGIPGVFHGPAWYYFSLLPFIVTQGDPVLMGWFWWGLAVVATLTFFVSVRFFTGKAIPSLLATLGFALLFIPLSASPVNNYMADLFSFLVFIIWYRWLEKRELWVAALGWFGLGTLVQFQMAFAVPLAIVWGPVFLWIVYRHKLWWQLLTLLGFFPPLVTFFVFEIRHDWLQLRSVLQYVQASSSSMSMAARIMNRVQLAIGEGIDVFFLPPLVTALTALMFGVLGWRTKRKDIRGAMGLFVLWYFGWWALTTLFSGVVWSYYFSPFFAIVFLLLAKIASHSRIALALLILGVLHLFIQSRNSLIYTPDRFNGASWQLLQRISADALNQPDLGYFLYAQDQFAYPLKYAFSWEAKKRPELKASPFTKRENIVVIKAADDPNNPHLTSDMWLQQQIRIDATPTQREQYPYGYQLERYQLSPEQQAVPIDPNLILDLHFR